LTKGTPTSSYNYNHALGEVLKTNAKCRSKEKEGKNTMTVLSISPCACSSSFPAITDNAFLNAFPEFELTADHALALLGRI
jgi:hypothetical protein